MRNHRNRNLFLFFIIASVWLTGKESKKIDPRLKSRLENARMDIRSGLYKDTDPVFDVLIRAGDLSSIKAAGFRLRSVHGLFATAFMNLSEIGRLSRFSGVETISLSTPCQILLDRSMPEIGMDQVWNGSNGSGRTGKNVIIGIVDTGIDWQHQDFIDNGGNTRILYIWDQTITGHSPEEFGYGSEYSQADIQQALDQNNESLAGGKDFVGHGTHIAGIAAGSGRAAGPGKPSGVYVGGAPDAYLIVVKGSDTASISSNQILDGLNYIFQKADALGMPCVVNLSLGRRNGSHDGMDDFELDVNSYLFDPGHAIVVAAGNDGDQRIHVSHEFNPFIEDTLCVELSLAENPSGRHDYAELEAWIHHLSPMTIQLLDPTGLEYGPIYPEEEFDWPLGERTRIRIDNGSAGGQLNGDKMILIQLMDGDRGDELRAGLWKIKFSSISDRLDLWLVDHSMPAEIVSEIDPTILLNEPAHAKYAIAVGSYVTRSDWPSLSQPHFQPGGMDIGSLSRSSSPGPSRPNSTFSQAQNKPEITAPGETILSSYSHWTLNAPGDDYIADDGVHRAWAGTSFAAPHITGLVACMFESNPELDASFIKNHIILTARKDEFTGNVWNERWGFGKVDAEAAVARTSAVRIIGSRQPVCFQPVTCSPNPFNHSAQIHIDFSETGWPVESATLKCYDLRGRMIQEFSIVDFFQERKATLHWDGKDKNGTEVPSGIYLLLLNNGLHAYPQKITVLR